MSRHGIPLGRIFGITIDLDYSWFLIVGLLSWMLAISYYPAEFGGWSKTEYWVMGGVTAIMLFVSVLVHELAHSLVAQSYGIAVPRITLFLFGGVSQIAEEPSGPAEEFWITLVGPLTSFALAAFFWELEPLVSEFQQLFALLKYLALLNLVLALFNLVPGFPLDGGRALRAVLWRITGNYHRATIAAGFSGRFFGFLMIFWGVWQALIGNFGEGIWIAFIGWYLESAAGSQMQQEGLKNLLGRHKVSDAMQKDFPTAPGATELKELVDRWMLPAKTRYVIVTDSEQPRGIVTLTAIRGVPRQAWPIVKAEQIMVPFQKLATTEPDTALWSALEKMGRNGVNQLPVLQGAGIVGILAREDVLHYLAELQAFAT